MEQLEATVKEWVSLQTTDAGIALLAMRHESEREEADNRIAELRAKEENLRKRSKRLTDAYVDEIIDADDFRERKEELDDALQAVREQLNEAGAKLLSKPPSPEKFEGLLAVWDRIEVEELNAALKELISHIVVSRPVKQGKELNVKIIPRWEQEPPNLHFGPGSDHPANRPSSPQAKPDRQPDQ